MSKADEMFEELDFKKTVDSETELKYEYQDKILGDVFIHTFLFAKKAKMIYSYRDCINNHQSMGFSIQELQAINEKCKELGWL